MTLQELSKLPKNQVRVIDRTKENHYPARWTDVVHFIHGDKIKSVRRYNGFLAGLCDGSKDPFPTVPERGGLRCNSGRKAIDPKERKQSVKIGVRQSVIDSLGGQIAVQKILIQHLKTLI